MRIALIHDVLVNRGGAERVAYYLHQVFPQAPLYTSCYDSQNTYSEFSQVDIRTSFLQNITKSEKAVKMLFPLSIVAMKNFNFSSFDLILSSSTWCAKNIRVGSDTCHICLNYTPFRLAWEPQSYINGAGRVSLIKRNTILKLSKYLRRIDFNATQRINYLFTTCNNTAAKILKYYQREAEVINAPVDMSAYSISDKIGDYFLVISRLNPYKRIDIAIKAFNKLKIPLKIVGDGPIKPYLNKISCKNIEFLGSVDETRLKILLSSCQALIFPSEEDYGLVPLEAQASGRPVIAYGKGGILETTVPYDGINDKFTAILFREQAEGDLIRAVNLFYKLKFDPDKIRKYASRFDIENFKNKVKDFVNHKYEEFLLKRSTDVAL